MEPSRKPLNVLKKQVHKSISIILKNGVEYAGEMTQCDNYMNIMLDGASECVEEQKTANYGNILIRGNNILYIVIDSSRNKSG